MTFVVVLLLLMSVGIALSLTVFFPIETITVSGNTRYAEGDLIEASGISVGDNIFCFRASAAGNRVVSQYPYVEKARVTRIFPNTVSIEITEAQADTAIETEEGYLLLSRRGRILEGPSPYPPEERPRVIGFSLTDIQPGDYLPASEQERFDLLREIEAGLQENEISPVSIIDLRDLIDMRLLYDGRLAVELGSKIDLAYKLRAAAEVIRLSVDSRTVGILDVSARPTMRLREINLYDPDLWPFPESMRGDYERSIQKIRPVVPQEEPSPAPGYIPSPAPDPTPDASSDASDPPTGEEEQTQPPADQEPADNSDEQQPDEEEGEEEDQEDLPPLTIIEA